MNIFGPKTEFIEEGVDPLAPPRKRKFRIPMRWMTVGAITIGTVLCLSIAGLAYKAFAQPPTPTPTATELLPPAFSTLAAQFPIGQPTGTQATQLSPTALLPTQISASEMLTGIARGTFPVEWTATATAENFLTQQVHDDANMTATIGAMQPGTPVNVSGIHPQETIVYVYPTLPPTPWIVLASPTVTPWIITATPSVTPYPTYTPYPTWTFTPYPTYTPYPTQTAWIIVTSPPIATVIITREVTREVTVVVTATPSETPTSTETPTETATP